jgi:hypothetical protein
MAALRLQTKFLLSMLLVSAGLTSTTLIIVERTIDNQVRRHILRDLDNSVRTFQSFQRQREQTLSHSAELLADLPTVRALMTTRHATTIQDPAIFGDCRAAICLCLPTPRAKSWRCMGLLLA